MRVVVEEKDGIRDQYARALADVGAEKANKAFARALTHEGKKGSTQVRRAIVRASSIPMAMVRAGTVFHRATSGNLRVEIVGRGAGLPLRHFKPRQFQAGVRAKVWGRFKMYPSAFGAPGDNPNVVAALSGNPFVRIGAKRLPITMLYGPGIANELVKDEPRKAFDAIMPHVSKRALHELSRLLGGAR